MDRASRVAPLLTEAEIAAAWEHRRYRPADLVDSLGRTLSVVFPGRRWGGPGPDFQGAVLATGDGTLVRGDVEVHRRASDWLRHGHARDPAYARVVLHVVQVNDGDVLDAAGRLLPALALRVDPSARPLPLLPPCTLHAADPLPLVEEAGRARFAARAARFEADVAAVGADQALWRGVAEALGYSHNATPLARLADLCSWAEVAHLARERGPAALAGYLLVLAGLADFATPRERVGLAARPLLGATDWRLAGCRPGNHPARRLRGLAALAVRWSADPLPPAERLLEVLADAARRRSPRPGDLVQAEPWVGRGRARVVAINALLPLGQALGSPVAADIYARMPGEPLNRVARYMAALLAAGREVRFRTACQRQGLLHLYRVACADRACGACAAAGAEQALDEVNLLPLVGRRERAAAAAADDTVSHQPGAARRARAEQAPALQGGRPLPAQHAGQLHPLDALHSSATVTQLHRHGASG